MGKHDFLCINICWVPREVLKPEPERRGFQHLPRGPADVNVSESRCDRYYCIKHFFRSKTLEILLQKVLFTCTYNGAEKHVTGERFENAASRAKTNVIRNINEEAVIKHGKLRTFALFKSVFQKEVYLESLLMRFWNGLPVFRK